jgi:hypothetical protein
MPAAARQSGGFVLSHSDHNPLIYSMTLAIYKRYGTLLYTKKGVKY